MRIGIVSTYPPIECGIATYSQFLVEALRRRGDEVYVFSEFGGKGEYVLGTYSSQRDDIAASIFAVVSKMTPDVLHIQYEFGLYGAPKGTQIIELILRCRLAGLPVVTTLHTVKDELLHDDQVVLRVVLQESTAVIVHEDFHKENMVQYFGQAEKLFVIPHGVREVDEIPDARETLGLVGKKILLLCGYLRETKRLDRVVRVFPAVTKAVPEAVLLVAVKSRSLDHPGYQHAFYRMLENSPVANRIDVLHGQFPQHIFDTFLSAADVVPLPYELGAQSGIMAHCFAFRKPVVTSDLPAFQRWVEASGGGLVARSDEELEQHMITLLRNDELRVSLSENIACFVRKTASWRVVADNHFDVYEKCAWHPTPKSRYFG